MGKKFGFYLIAVLFPAYAFFQLASLNTLAASLIATFPGSPELISKLSTIYLLTDAVFLIPAGLLLDRIYLKYLLPFALTTLLLGLLLIMTAHNSDQIYYGRLLAGLGHSFSFLTGFKIARDCFSEKNRAISMSMVITMAMLGGLIAQTPFEWLINFMGWRKAMLFNIAFGLLLLLYSMVMLRHFVQDIVSTDKSNVYYFYKKILQSAQIPANYLLGITIGLLSIPLLLIGSAMGDIYMSHVVHLSVYKASLVSECVFLGTVIGMPIFGWLGDKYGNLLKILLWATSAGFLVGLSMLFFKQYNIYLQAALFFMIAFFSAVQSIAYVLVSKFNHSDVQNTAMALTNVIIMLLSALMPLIAGFIALKYLLVIVPIALAVCLYVLFLIKKQHPLAAV